MAGDPNQLVQQAEKALSGASGGFSFFSANREDKYQNAADLFHQAGNAFKMQQNNIGAGQAFERAAKIQSENLKEPDDAANTMVDAFKAYKSVKPDDAARCLNVAINRYCAKGNFRRAASHKENLGDLFENDLRDPRQAMEAYESAAGWYEGDNASALANKLWLKVADLAALQKEYQKAITNYEKVAAASINNNLMRYSVKEYFLKAGLCHLGTKDIVGAQRALDKYRTMDPSFGQQREHMLLVDLSEAVEAGDREKFEDKLYMYDQVSRLDNWKTAVLMDIKKGIEEADDEFS